MDALSHAGGCHFSALEKFQNVKVKVCTSKIRVISEAVKKIPPDAL